MNKYIIALSLFFIPFTSFAAQPAWQIALEQANTAAASAYQEQSALNSLQGFIAISTAMPSNTFTPGGILARIIFPTTTPPVSPTSCFKSNRGTGCYVNGILVGLSYGI